MFSWWRRTQCTFTVIICNTIAGWHANIKWNWLHFSVYKLLMCNMNNVDFEIGNMLHSYVSSMNSKINYIWQTLYYVYITYSNISHHSNYICYIYIYINHMRLCICLNVQVLYIVELAFSTRYSACKFQVLWLAVLAVLGAANLPNATCISAHFIANLSWKFHITANSYSV